MPAIAYIDTSAFDHNLQRVKALAPHSSVLAMIKANAYGHGILRAAKALAAADGFGVARTGEALVLRNHGFTKPIAIMAGFLDAEELRAMAEYDLIPAIHTEQQLKLLFETPLEKPISVWLKMDTGMHRLGFDHNAISPAYRALLENPKIRKDITVFTHFAESDELSSPKSRQQLTLFQQTIHWPGPKSLANSAAIIAWQDSHADWVRPGIMLYGVSPFTQQVAADYDLKPVMTLSSTLIAVHHLKRGDAIGYGSTFVCPEDMPIGVAAIGYGDGYPRHAPNGTPVLVDHVLCQLAGRVSMDLITIDLRPHPHATFGSEVVLWGRGLPVETVAKCAGTIAYELLCHVTSRVKFIEIND